ncbi:MAG: helix-turn-helix domain-containing protein, partial [Verrucomicrobiota bacterium]
GFVTLLQAERTSRLEMIVADHDEVEWLRGEASSLPRRSMVLYMEHRFQQMAMLVTTPPPPPPPVSAHRGQQLLELTAREYALLEFLMLRAGEVVSRTEIEEHIYDDMISPMSNVVDTAIYALRKKIAVNADSGPLIHTKRGHGYILESRAL